jgi:hypothetical protein
MSSAVGGGRHARPSTRAICGRSAVQKKDLFAIGNFRRSRQAYGNALPESQAGLRATRL